MKNINAKRVIKSVLMLMVLLLATGRTMAQDPVSLFVGDAVPELRYSKWIKGNPVKNLADGNMYIVEFWATWCGPCIAAMPHLSDLAEKYKGSVTFIGADVWEKTGDLPYASSLPKVVSFVEGNSKNMRYHIIADTDDQFNYNHWLKAAGIRGIPTTFIIHKGKIAWIGHPLKLDDVIDPILKGTFDLKGYQETYNKTVLEQAKVESEQNKKYKALIDARNNKDYKRIISVVDSMSAGSAELKVQLAGTKFGALMRVDQAAALALANEIVLSNPDAGPDLGLTISAVDGLSKDLYQFGASQLKDIPLSSFVANILGLLYSKSGDFKSAVEIQQTAVDLAKAELKDPQFSGRVFDYTVTDYEEKLKAYKQKI